ncbi:MarR family transcriptional regulator [Parenemella sanctibonifatiensis]|uniref:MarR family transcriptional regulator n=2 Tax=Parenemella sanctibonifatiensis TaxID=2016505 RepID=A0A255ECW9_9ACTN|nr:MarR family transcriptional regulator [Parenemella sanctibonifatiensis]
MGSMPASEDHGAAAAASTPAQSGDSDRTDSVRAETADQLSIAVARLSKAMWVTRPRIPRAAPDLEPSHLPIIYRLATEPLRLSDLAAGIHSAPSTASRQVATLVDSGYVARTPDPQDGRAQLLELTERGQEVLEQIRRTRREWIRELLADWSEDDAQNLHATLVRFTDAVMDSEFFQHHTSSERPT